MAVDGEAEVAVGEAAAASGEVVAAVADRRMGGRVLWSSERAVR